MRAAERYLSAVMLIDPPAGDASSVQRRVCWPRIVVREARDMRERRDVCHTCAAT
jgi:hypothetical protein